MKTIKQVAVVSYAGHDVKASGVVNLAFNANYGELNNVLMFSQFLGKDFSVRAKLASGDNATLVFGVFNLNAINVKKNGRSVVKLASINTAVDLEKIGEMAEHFGEEFKILLQANVDEDE